MTEEERKSLEKEALLADGWTAFRIGQIAAIDEMLGFLNNDLPKDPGARVMAIAMELIYRSRISSISEEILRRHGAA